MNPSTHTYDYVVIGSGFGGSVSALRLAEKGYSVLVIEKGKWFSADDFPKTSWNLPKWLWFPGLHFFGIMKMSFFRHATILSGTGVGGGSLVYANTLPVPKKAFYQHGSWKGLCDWETELSPYYKTALKMMGAVQNPFLGPADIALQSLARETGREDYFSPTEVSVFFGEKEQTVDDPFFNGKGPQRTGCRLCGGCMTGCRYNAKNTLDKNYLFLAQQNGAEILAEHEVSDISELGNNSYKIVFRSSTRWFSKKKTVNCKGIVLAGGVLGTVPLLLKLKQRSLPRISDFIGHDIRTNNESLLPVTTTNKGANLSEGIAIGSIVHTDERSHLEPCRYSHGSGFWRLLMMPSIFEPRLLKRYAKLVHVWLSHPATYLKLLFVRDWAKNTSILLFMQSIDTKLRFKRTKAGRIKSSVQEGTAPTPFIPEMEQLSAMYARQIQGHPTSFSLEVLLGIPSTAHIMGGAVIGKNKESGVIDVNQEVFGYKNMYVCDGSALSANPGVNPSLSILAMTERVMEKIPLKES